MGLFVVAVAYFLAFGMVDSAGSKRNYIINYESGKLLSYNKSYGTNVNFNYIYTTAGKTAINVSGSYEVIKDNVGSECRMHGIGYRIINKERKLVPLSLNINICDVLTNNPYNFDVSKYGNATGCDVKKGFYYLKNFSPDINVPPVVPSGTYLVQGTVTLRKDELFKMEWLVNLLRS